MYEPHETELPPLPRANLVVTAFTIALARAMHISPHQIRVLARGVYLYDIGKLALPETLRHKSEPLSRDEAAVMRQDCHHGYQLLRKIPFLKDAAEIVYSHQERWDGTGYPRGLKGDNIPIGARMFAVAHVLDTITSAQPDRLALSLQEAREEIQSGSGRRFDPEVVQVFMSMPDNIWKDLRKSIDGGGSPPEAPQPSFR